MLLEGTRTIFREALSARPDAIDALRKRTTDLPHIDRPEHAELYASYIESCTAIGVPPRDEKVFVWLVEATECTIIPPFDLEKVKVPNELEEDKIRLRDVIHLWCILDILIDDAYEHANKTKCLEFLDHLYQVSKNFFNLKADKPQDETRAIDFVVLNTPDGYIKEHKNYLLTVCQYIALLFKELQKFPNHNNPACKDKMKKEYKALIDSCVFSRKYSDVLKGEDRAAAIALAPTFEAYIRQTKANMGITMMLTFTAMLLEEEEDIDRYLSLGSFVDPTRIGNGFVHEEEIGQLLANSILHLAILKGHIDLSELRKIPIRERTVRTRSAIEAVLPEAMDQWFLLSKAAIEEAKDLTDLYSADITSASGYIRSRLSNLLTLELARASNELCNFMHKVVNSTHES